MKRTDSEYLLQVCSMCALVTSKWTVTHPASKLTEMAIRDDHLYVILEMLKQY